MAGNLVSTTDALGNTTRYQYDNRNRQLRTINALGGSSSVKYNANGNVTESVDPAGNATLYFYDQLNREIVSVAPRWHGESESNAKQQQPIHDKYSNGQLCWYFLGHITGRDSLLQRRWGFGHDLSRTQSDPDLGQTDYIYDDLDRLVETISPPDQSGHRAETDTTYDVFGNVTRQTASYQQGTSPTSVTTSSYDSMNRLTSQTQTDLNSQTPSRTTQYAYDSNGNLIMQELDAGGIALFAHGVFI